MPLAMVESNSGLANISFPATSAPGTELMRLVFEVEEPGEYDLHYYVCVLQKGTGNAKLVFNVDGVSLDPQPRFDVTTISYLFEQSVWLSPGTHSVMVGGWVTGTAGVINTNFDVSAGHKLWVDKAPKTIAQINGNQNIAVATGTRTTATEVIRLVFEIEEAGEYDLQYFCSIAGNGTGSGWRMTMVLDGAMVSNQWRDSAGAYDSVRMVWPVYLTPGTHEVRLMSWAIGAGIIVYAGNEVSDGQWLRVRKVPFDTLARIDNNTTIGFTAPTRTLISKLVFEVSEAGEYDIRYYLSTCDNVPATATYWFWAVDVCYLDQFFYNDNDQQAISMAHTVWLSAGTHSVSVYALAGSGSSAAAMGYEVDDGDQLWVRKAA